MIVPRKTTGKLVHPHATRTAFFGQYWASIMVRVTFTSNIQRHVQCQTVDIVGDTVREVLNSVFEKNEQARGYVLDDRGAVRKHMIIFINGQPIKDRTLLSDEVSAGDEIYVMQALSGG